MKIRLILACALLLGCGPSPEEARRLAQEKLDALERETLADLHLAKAECEAHAIEFPGDRIGLDACLKTIESQQQIAAATLDTIGKRRIAIEQAR